MIDIADADVVQRLRRSVGPDAALDRDIAALVGVAQALPYTSSAAAAETLLPEGFFWRGGTCYLSSEVLIAPDYNDPMHRERLLREYRNRWSGGTAEPRSKSDPEVMLHSSVRSLAVYLMFAASGRKMWHNRRTVPDPQARSPRG
jgi:hypothetical protein